MPHSSCSGNACRLGGRVKYMEMSLVGQNSVFLNDLPFPSAVTFALFSPRDQGQVNGA